METPTREAVDDDRSSTTETSELLDLQTDETPQKMLQRLLELAKLISADLPEADATKKELLTHCCDSVALLAKKLKQCYRSQEESIKELQDQSLEKEIELKRLYITLAQGTESPFTQEQHRVFAHHYATERPFMQWMENISVDADDARQFAHFDKDTEGPKDSTTSIVPPDDGKQSPKHDGTTESDAGPIPDLPTAVEPQPGSSGEQLKRKVSEESLPAQAFDFTFPSGRGKFRRPGFSYEKIPPLLQTPDLSPTAATERGTKWKETKPSLGERDSKNIVEHASVSHGGNVEETSPRSSGQDSKLSQTTGAKDTENHFDGREHWSQPLKPWSEKHINLPSVVCSILGQSSESTHTLWKAGWELGRGQATAWWHLLLFLSTTINSAITSLLRSGPNHVGYGHVPTASVFTVPKSSWCILMNQGIFFANFLSFLAWRRQIDVMLLANGLSRQYMLDFVYEESTLTFSMDTGIVGRVMREVGNLWPIHSVRV